ncbi:MAG: FG-GAP-like repeat-containing protein [Balneolaceae bacterium]
MSKSLQNVPVLLFFLFLVLFVSSCTSETAQPDPESDEYRAAVSDFFVSLAASQTDEALFAYNKMNSVVEQYPREAAGWANLGVYTMRQGNFELASEHLARAREYAPGHSDILFLSGLLESRVGDVDQAIVYFRRGLESDQDHPRLSYALIMELERQDDSANADEILDLLVRLHESRPENLAILYELIRFSIKVEADEQLEASLGELVERTDRWPDDVRSQFQVVWERAQERAYSDLAIELTFLRNGLDELPSFQNDLGIIRLGPNEIGYLITQFVWLPQPQVRAAEPDRQMNFLSDTSTELPAQAEYARSVTLLEDLPPFSIFMQDGRIVIDQETYLEFPGTVNTNELASPYALTEIDVNLDFLNDIAMAGDQGFRLYRQNSDQSFNDVTAESGISSEVRQRPYSGVWPADLDLDGDLDLVLAPLNGTPVHFRNNSDGTFTSAELFSDVESVNDFIYVDLNGSGAPEALFLDRNGILYLYQNNRSGTFTLSGELPVQGKFAAFSAADINADSFFNLLLLSEEGAIHRIDYLPESGEWDTRLLVEDSGVDPAEGPGRTRLMTADFDNNGRLDLLVSESGRTVIWLGDDSGVYHRLEEELPGNIYSVFDIDGDERVDLLGLAADNTPYQLLNRGTRNYNGFSIRARASGTEGDGRINSFGIGGQMEVRSGLLYQKQLINTPIVHFGLGEYEEAEMLRIIWPNGSVQAEFAELGMGSTIFNQQILKGSCPWLFAHDGHEMHFITDILWRSPLGLRINAQETAGVAQTLDRVRIPGERLNPRNGLYDLRITAELWETHFFDFVELVAVDHPEGTEIFVDERFGFSVPDLSTRLMTTPRPVAKVLDGEGDDVTDKVYEQDGDYLKSFEKSAWQGVAEEHTIEVELGEDAPAGRPLWLVASGWLRPTDSSINLALSQGSIVPPRGLRIDVSDGKGGWIRLHDDYGFPAGKLKTILIELDGVFPDSQDRRIRLNTTSEIYWDSIEWAEALPDDQFVEYPLEPETRELRFRGYSDWYRPDELSPKLADYNVISGTAPRWRDLTGYHTRFGNVGELLEEIDDRYVIMNAGDELVLRFHEREAPPQGWTRSYVFVSDGWEKDGDYNTEASATVLPLPYHGMEEYDYNPDLRLYEDPVYQQHREDWARFHTRYITPKPFQYALKFDRPYY